MVLVFDFAAFLAAVIFVIIPPLPSVLLLGPAYLLSFLFVTDIFSTNSADSFIFGSLVKSPFWSVRIIKFFASLRFATNDANVSLSPNFISSVEIVSFAFIIGIVLYLMRLDKVFLALR